MFKQNQSSMSVQDFFHAWYVFITGCNHVIFIIHKCHSSLNYPCMKGCYCCHKGMDIGISYVVIPVHVYKKFFWAFLQRSSVHHLVVPSESILCHWELSEYTEVLSGSWSLSGLKDRHLCTGLGVVCGIP